MNTNFQVIGLTRLANEPESTAPEADVLSTTPQSGFATAEYLKNSLQEHETIKS